VASALLSGLDVSSVQGAITPAQWTLIRDRGTRFVVAKVGNGNDPEDPTGMPNLTAAESAGLVAGAYHFPFALPPDAGHPGREPEAQAAAHYRQCMGLGTAADELPATVDCEWPRPEQWGKPIPGIDNSTVDQGFLQDFFTRYLVAYETLQGCPMIVYGDPWFLTHLAPPSSWASRPLWEAAYGDSAPAVAPWAGWSLRQLSGGGGRLPNGAPVDTDCVADEATLARLLAR
jgi:GH25 family lysozyme M1 (1,4-beta-N-acetylmuramidase)